VVGLAQAGCAGQTWLKLPADPSATGPWPVSSHKLSGITARNLTLEIFYPAVPGSNTSTSGRTFPQCQYDIREHMPKEQAHKIPDSDNPNPYYPNCYHGAGGEPLPLDTAHGKYPLMVFIHGTAGFRTQSLHILLHWASRGFIVASADYPGIQVSSLYIGVGAGASVWRP
jgi:hypothetical protein